jgi:hypothetical protein
MPELRIVDHPLVQHKLSLMRAHDTPTGAFRQLMREVGLLLGYEATRDLPVEEVEVETPLERARLPMLAGKKLCLVSILRAGNGLLDGILELVPSARVGHIGLYREPRTLQAIEYYLKLPDDLPERNAGDRQFGGRGDLAAHRAKGALGKVCLPRRGARGGRAGARCLPRCPGRDRRARPLPRRTRLYFARSR